MTFFTFYLFIKEKGEIVSFISVDFRSILLEITKLYTLNINKCVSDSCLSLCIVNHRS